MRPTHNPTNTEYYGTCMNYNPVDNPVRAVTPYILSKNQELDPTLHNHPIIQRKIDAYKSANFIKPAGSSNNDDLVECKSCKLQLQDWEESDDVNSDHAMWAAQQGLVCPYIETNNIGYTLKEDEELDTTKHKAEYIRNNLLKLREAGFVKAKGSHNSDDEVKTTDCGLRLCQFEKTDDPLTEHIRHASTSKKPNCIYLQTQEQSMTQAKDESLVMLDRFLKKNPKSNVSISPQGLWQMLNMIYKGATGNTKQLLDQYLQGFRPSRNLRSTNDLAIRPSVTLSTCFQKGLQQLGAQLHKTDFTNPAACERTTDRINKRVARTTDNMITDAVDPCDLNPDTVAALVNAIYFNKKWEQVFEPNGTMIFRTGNGEHKNAESMFKKTYTQYAETEKAQAVVLPYVKNSSCPQPCMIVLLPKQGFKTTDLSSAEVEKLVASLKIAHKQDVKVTMPAFKIESEKMELADILKDMGLGALFNKIDMEFTGNLKKDELHLSSVLQKVVIDVDREGTKAAAVTSGFMLDCLPPPCKKIICDKTFMYMIADNWQLGAEKSDILFAGQVADPTITSTN